MAAPLHSTDLALIGFLDLFKVVASIGAGEELHKRFPSIKELEGSVRTGVHLRKRFASEGLACLVMGACIKAEHTEARNERAGLGSRIEPSSQVLDKADVAALMSLIARRLELIKLCSGIHETLN